MLSYCVLKQVVHIITAGIESVVGYFGCKYPWPGVTTAIPVSCIRETAVCMSLYSYLKFVYFGAVSFPSYLFCAFPLIRHLCNSRGSSQSARLPSRRSFHLAASSSTFTSAVLTPVTQITPSRGHNWKRSAHVNCASSLISKLYACHNYTEYGRILTKFGI